jgi:hypothetical protein
MDLLDGVKALDCRNQDITANIKIFIIKADSTYTQIEQPRIFTVHTAGTIHLKYQVMDNYGNTISSEIFLIVKQ